MGSNGQNITDISNNKIEDDGTAKIKTILKELLSQQEKSLYFGIKMQWYKSLANNVKFNFI